MRRYSAFAIAREAARYHTGWGRAWAAPEPKQKYDAIIVGAGGHGLATAYYLGKNFGITKTADPNHRTPPTNMKNPKIFQRPKNHKDGLDFDDFRTK